MGVAHVLVPDTYTVEGLVRSLVEHFRTRPNALKPASPPAVKYYLPAVPCACRMQSPRFSCSGARRFSSGRARPTRRRRPRSANYTISATLDPINRLIIGRGRLVWRNTSNEPATELRFHMYWNAWRDDRSSWMREARLDGDRVARGSACRRQRLYRPQHARARRNGRRAGEPALARALHRSRRRQRGRSNRPRRAARSRDRKRRIGHDRSGVERSTCRARTRARASSPTISSSRTGFPSSAYSATTGGTAISSTRE